MLPRTVCFSLLMLVCGHTLAGGAFGFAEVRESARGLSQQPFRSSTNRVPQELLELSYDQYNLIQFRRGHGLWAGDGLPFQMEFFLPGSVHKDMVDIHEVSDQGVRRIPFSTENFSTGSSRFDLPPTLAYAGFRIVDTVQQFGEVASFLGASYFRMVGRGQQFGASARGLALNTARIGHEEFPAFRQFWIARPAMHTETISLWALLDSPSAAGAFEFEIRPGTDTVASVKSSFFPRQIVQEFGVVPLTSMFFYDQNSHLPFGDFRPAVHDSDGLLLHTGSGEFLWRPLESGKTVRVNSYLDENPKGFGLMQRARAFDTYQDLGAHYERRPSVWVKPTGNWGRGRVELVQLPSNTEYADNVVAFWVPEKPPQPGQELNIAYELHWLTNEVASTQLGHVGATRIGRVPGQGTTGTDQVRLVVDFEGGGLEALGVAEKIEAEVECGSGAKVTHQAVIKNEVNGSWRLVLDLTTPSKAVDLRAALTRSQRPVTETWIWTWQP